MYNFIIHELKKFVCSYITCYKNSTGGCTSKTRVHLNLHGHFIDNNLEYIKQNYFVPYSTNSVLRKIMDKDLM